MTDRQIEIIENSWDFLLLNPEETSELFYTKLFSLDPGLRVLFGEDISSQAQKLTSMITFVVHKLNDLDEIMSDVKELGVRHKKYGVKQEYFAIVEVALLWTLESRLGKLWNTETKDAWAKIYSILSKTMMEAVDESQPIVAQ
ncbi:MAG TPA: globin domain-containing protein [Cyclobacteriaceae bacterium]|nr:globin domain-containing protein [Cyclobacteriaceae bacterium]